MASDSLTRSILHSAVFGNNIVHNMFKWHLIHHGVHQWIRCHDDNAISILWTMLLLDTAGQSIAALDASTSSDSIQWLVFSLPPGYQNSHNSSLSNHITTHMTKARIVETNLLHYQAEAQALTVLPLLFQARVQCMDVKCECKTL